MSIASEITRLQTAKSNIKTVLESNGVTVPSNATLDAYPTLIATLSGGILKFIGQKVFTNVQEWTDDTNIDTLSTGITVDDYAFGIVIVTCDSQITTTTEWGMSICPFGRYTSNGSIMNETAMQLKGSTTLSYSDMVNGKMGSNAYGVWMPNNISSVVINRKAHGTACPKIRGGTYTVKVYGFTNGSPAGWTADDIATNNIVGDIVLSDDVITIVPHAFRYRTKITGIVGNEVTTVSDSAFYYAGDSAITPVSLPKVTTMQSYAFQESKIWGNLTFPALTTIQTAVFKACQSIRSLYLPALTTISGGQSIYNSHNIHKFEAPNLTGKAQSEIARQAYALMIADLGKTTEITTNAFAEDYLLTALVLRRTADIAAMGATSALWGCITQDWGMGYVYVPEDLIETYQAATNWITHYGTNPHLFRALEDYTVDGTTTGELDYTKIIPTVFNTPVYTAQNLVFDGTNYVDTQVNLFSGTGGKFTILMDYTPVAVSANSALILQCKVPDQDFGFWLRNNGKSASSTYFYFYPNANGGSQLVDPTSSNGTQRIRICIRSTGNRVEMFVWTSSNRDGYNLYKRFLSKSVTGEREEINATLLLGAGYNTSSVVANYSKGTIHDIKVYNTAISNWEIADYLGWTEVIPQE